MTKTPLPFAINLAYTAGNIMRKNFSLGMKRQWKDDESPVTITDISINNLVIEAIKQTFPDDSIIAEEGSYTVKNSTYTWVCDPLDGTIPFSHGIPTYAFSLALTKNGESILGVIYDPVMDRLLYAEKGKGAFMNKKRIYVSKTDTVKRALIDVIWWKAAPYDISFLMNTLEDNYSFPLRLKSYVYGAMLTACGEAGAAIFAGKTPWDVAAIKIIVEEAGGKVTDLFGNEQLYDRDVKGVVASNGLIHKKLLELIHRNKLVSK